MPIRTISTVKDPKADLVTIEEELVEVLDAKGLRGEPTFKTIKSKKYQMKLSEYTPMGIYAARKKHFGKQG